MQFALIRSHISYIACKWEFTLIWTLFVAPIYCCGEDVTEIYKQLMTVCLMFSAQNVVYNGFAAFLKLKT